MTIGVVLAIYDRLIPGWRVAPPVNGNRRVLCPFHDDRKKPNLCIHEERGVWTCWAGCGSGGAWDFARRLLGEDGARALVRELDKDSADYDARVHAARSHRPRQDDGIADPEITRKIEREWASTVADDGTAARYLRMRGLSGVVPQALRLRRALMYWDSGPNGTPQRNGEHPAIVAQVKALNGTVVALHRTYLAPGGNGKAEVPQPKKLTPAIFSGATHGAAIHLAEPTDGCLGLAEGVETGLAVMEATGAPTWACVSAGGLQTVELPPHIQTVDVWADHDRSGAGLAGAEQAAARLHAEGRIIRILLPERVGDDWLDVLVRDGAAALRQAHDHGPRWTPDETAEEVDAANPHTTTGEAWDPPVEFDAPLSGPLVPLEAFPRVLADYISEVAESVQVPIDFVAAGMLGIIAAAGAGRAVVAVGKTHIEPLNLYVAPVLESGERKQALRHLTFPLEEEQRRLTVQAQPAIASATQERAIAAKQLERIQKAAAKATDDRERDTLVAEAIALQLELPVVPPTPQLVFDDITPEYLAKVLAEQHGRAAIVSEEAGSLFEVLAGRYSKGAPQLDTHLKAYDGGTIDTGRISRERVFVERPALTILVTPQPVVLDRIATHPEFRARGLLARFGFVLPQSLVGSRLYRDRPVSEAARRAYAAAIEGILALPLATPTTEPTILTIADDALKIWADYADDVERAQKDGGVLSRIRDWAGKSAGRVARIAGGFHLVEHLTGSRCIAPETITAAWVVGQWLQDHARVAFARMDAPSHVQLAQWIVAWIRRRGLPTFSLKQLADHKRLTPEEFHPALQELERRSFIRPLPSPPAKGVGRPRSQGYEVNPRMHSQNSQNSPSDQLRELCEPSPEPASPLGEEGFA